MEVKEITNFTEQYVNSGILLGQAIQELLDSGWVLLPDGTLVGEEYGT